MRPEQVPPRAECPEPARWLAPDGNATEKDVSALIGAFVRALKPDYIVETGSYYGDTAAVMGHALKVLGRGELLTIDIDPDMAALTRKACEDLPVTCVVAKASDVVPTAPIDLLFIDCDLKDRLRQIRNFRQYASPRCVILVHDTALIEACEGIPEFYAEMARAVADGIVEPWLRLPTPRGLSMSRYC